MISQLHQQKRIQPLPAFGYAGVAVKGKVPARHIDSCNLMFDFYCIVADPALSSNERIDATARSGPEGMRLVTLKAVSGPGDDGEPVMTVMLPGED